MMPEIYRNVNAYAPTSVWVYNIGDASPLALPIS
jgi:hypothetical protein